MKKKAIIVADDFGFSEAYSIGALKAYKEGIVTVLSLMPNMENAEAAVQLAKQYAPEACLVQHTNFVQGKPCEDPSKIPSLVDENGNFYRSSQWKSEVIGDTKCVGNIMPAREDCYKETVAQLERFKELTGNYPCHFEGHSVGTKAVTEAFCQVADEYGIHCYAKPEVETDTMYVAHELGSFVSDYMKILMRGSRIEDFLNDSFGLEASPYEINVMHFHPGYVDAYVLAHSSLTKGRCYDLEALCSREVKEWFENHDIQLVDFRAVYK